MTDKHDKLVEMARLFHDTYETLAPSFGYTTRGDTKMFDADSPNGKLMCATVEKVRDRIVASLCADAEPFVFEEYPYHCEAMGCGLEDRNITDRYEAMAYGWERAMERAAEAIPDDLYPASTVAAITAQRNAALARVAEMEARVTAWTKLYDRAINEANGMTNYVEDRPELRSAERRLDVIYADARALKDAALAARSGT